MRALSVLSVVYVHSFVFFLGAVYTPWGHVKCSASAQLLYSGTMEEKRNGDGANFL